MELPDGWLSEAEAGTLARYATGGCVLEIGAYLGRSTVALASTARLVVSVDHHRGSPEHQVDQSSCLEGTRDATDPGKVDTAPQFLANLTRLGVREKVCPIIADAVEVLPLLACGTFDMAFIDGAHDHASVVRDGSLALPLLRRYAPLIFHDGPTVARAIEAIAFMSRARHIEPLVGSLVALLPTV